MPDTTDPVVIVEHEFSAAPDDVWDTLTTDDGFSAWSGVGSHIDPQPGGRIDTPDQTTGRPRVGAVEHVDVNHHLRYRWWPTDEPDFVSTVDITVERIPTGTRVIVTERLVLPAVAFGAAQSSAWRGRGQCMARTAGRFVRA